MWDLLAALLKLLLGLAGIGSKPSKDERHETTAHDLGRQEARAVAAEAAVQSQAVALDLEVRMQEAQAAEAPPPSKGEPHEGTDLFHQD